MISCLAKYQWSLIIRPRRPQLTLSQVENSLNYPYSYVNGTVGFPVFPSFTLLSLLTFFPLLGLLANAKTANTPSGHAFTPIPIFSPKAEID